MKSYEKSDAHVTTAIRWTPGGSQTGSKAPGKAGPAGGYPAFLESGNGAWVTDVDGNTYMDFIAGLAAVGLGHADPRVAQAIAAAAYRGTLLSLPHRLEATVAERLCAFIAKPWAQQVRWLKTGSEATEAAVRIARCATGRDLVLTVADGYHAWHSWFQAVKPQHPGVPSALESCITGLTYGDKERWTQALALKPAAVILEPSPIAGGGRSEFLAWLVGVAHQDGVIVIFDEMVWGFRLAKAGGSEYFGVEPDLACYGKALGNGVPIACVVGSEQLMRHASVVSGTFGGDLLGLAAADAVLTAYQISDVIATMWDRGSQLLQGLRAIAAAYPKLGLTIGGYAVHPVVAFQDDVDHLKMSLLLQELADRSVLWHPSGVNVMAAMSERDVAWAVSQFIAAAHYVEKTLSEGAPIKSVLRGTPYAQAFARMTVPT